MVLGHTCRVLVMLGLISPLLGCGGWSPKVGRRVLESENRRLAEQSKAQLTEIANLKDHSREIEDQLIEAEEQLAMLDGQRDVQRAKLANLRRERESLQNHVLGAGNSTLPTGVSGQLAALAARFPSLLYDPATGISKLDTDILFDSGEAELKPAARQLLGEFVQILSSPEGKALKIMVVGHTDDQRIKGRDARHLYPNNWHLSAARALAVADHMRGLGLDSQRMGVAGFGQQQPIAANSDDRNRQQNRRVEIFVTSPDVPIVGMTETLTRLY